VSSLKERETVRESVGDLQTILFNTSEFPEIVCVCVCVCVREISSQF